MQDKVHMRKMLSQRVGNISEWKRTCLILGRRFGPSGKGVYTQQGIKNLGLCKKSARFNKVLTHTGKRTYTEIILSIIKKYSAIIFK